MAPKKSKRNILNMIPVRNYEWEDHETVSVLVPRFKSRLGKKFGRFLKRDPNYKVNLDDRSSDAWRLSDGNRTVSEIAIRLKEIYQEEVEPANVRVSELFNILEANRLIRYKNVNHHSYDTEEAENGAD